MQMRENLIKNGPLVEQEARGQKRYFIQRYNDVIEMYNENAASTPGQYLETMNVNPFFKKVSRRFGKKWVQILLILVLVLLPVFNLFCLGFLWFYYFHLHRQSKVHRKNTIICKDPLQSFYFLPDVCRQLGKHCTQMTIQTQDLEGFTFNEQLYETIKRRHNNQESITVIIYDQYFYDSFHLFKKEKYKVSAWILISILLISANVLILGSVLGWY